MIVGHDRQRSYLRRALTSERCPHALLLTGPGGVGKYLSALEGIRAMLTDHGAAAARHVSALGGNDENLIILRNLGEDRMYPLSALVQCARHEGIRIDQGDLIAAARTLEEAGFLATVSLSEGTDPVLTYRIDAGPLMTKSVPKRVDMARVQDRLASLRRENETAGRLATVLWDLCGSAPYNGMIKIDDVRESVQQALSYRSGAEPTCVILDDAHHLTDEAANALLKVLEEPPSKCVIFLITDHEHLLLPTIRSRCQTLSFGPVGTREIAATLEQVHRVTSTVRPAAVRAAQGSVRRALDFDEQAFFRQRDTVFDAWKCVLARNPEGIFLLSDALFPDESDRERRRALLQENLFVLMALVHDQVQVQLGRFDRLYAPDLQGEMGAVRPRPSVEGLFEAHEQIKATMLDLRYNLNERLALEGMTINLLRLELSSAG